MLRSPERFTLLQILSASLFLQKNGTPKGIGLAIARLGFAVNPAEREGMLRSPERFTLLQILSASLFLQKKWYTQRDLNP